MSTTLVLGLIAAVLAVWVVTLYNKLVRNRNMVQEAWSGIDVQLKKRTNLIPNLVETVKGYMGHERGVLEQVTTLRAAAQQAKDIDEVAKSQSLLSHALGKLFAVAENYPELKASQNFIELQTALSEVENGIEMARRYYNGAVRDNNILVESFPSNLVATMFRFEKSRYFELDNPAERLVPVVSF